MTARPVSTNRWVSCACGKRGYPDRKDARAAARSLDGPRLSTYECTQSGLFHIGHLPSEVTRGVIPRSQAGGPDTRRLPVDPLQRSRRFGGAA